MSKIEEQPVQSTGEVKGTVRFSGRGKEYCKTLIKGLLLLIPTVGIYRFWLVTNLRRHLWSNTRIDGEGLEYTGTGKELLIGFLIAMAVLLPLFLVLEVFVLLLEGLAVFAGLSIGLFFYLLIHYAMYRGRRYLATRTVFRGIRLWVTGSAWGYAFRAFGWDILTLLTLGVAFPWRQASLERYRMQHTQYGDI